MVCDMNQKSIAVAIEAQSVKMRFPGNVELLEIQEQSGNYVECCELA